MMPNILLEPPQRIEKSLTKSIIQESLFRSNDNNNVDDDVYKNKYDDTVTTSTISNSSSIGYHPMLKQRRRVVVGVEEKQHQQQQQQQQQQPPPSQQQQQQTKRRRRKHKIHSNFNKKQYQKIFFIVLSGWFVLLVFIFGFVGISYQIVSIMNPTTTTTATTSTNNNDIEHCTFHELYRAFHPTLAQTVQQQQQQQRIPNNSSTSSTNNSSNCTWRLEDVILRIPASSIVNRYSGIPRLNRGTKGGIFKAIVQLPSRQLPSQSQQTQTQSLRMMCTVALKTDLCYSTYYPIVSRWYAYLFSYGTSCVQYKSNHLWVHSDGQNGIYSYVGAEYTGALIWYSQIIQSILQQEQHGQEPQEQQNQNQNMILPSESIVPGLVPTWGIIVDTEYPLTWTKGVQLLGSPHPDPTITGVIMPILNTIGLYSIDDVDLDLDHDMNNNNNNDKRQSLVQQQDMTRSSTVLARAFLDSVQGLLYVNTVLGIAFRDLVSKNVAFYKTTTTTTTTKESTETMTAGISNGMNQNKNYYYASIIFDHSLLGIQKPDSCEPWTIGNNITHHHNHHHGNNISTLACQYCYEEKIFPPFDDYEHHIRKQIPIGHPYILGDMHTYRKNIIRLLQNRIRSLHLFLHDGSTSSNNNRTREDDHYNSSATLKSTTKSTTTTRSRKRYLLRSNRFRHSYQQQHYDNFDINNSKIDNDIDNVETMKQMLSDIENATDIKELFHVLVLYSNNINNSTTETTATTTNFSFE